MSLKFTRITSRFVITTLMAINWCLPATAFENGADAVLSGRTSVIDGDTIEIHGQRVRLVGIDAPESGQFCFRADKEQYRCGRDAAFALDELIGGGAVRCEIDGEDRYGRLLGICYGANNIELNRELVRLGQAISYYGNQYKPEELEAQSASAGLWAGTFMSPHDWRTHSR